MSIRLSLQMKRVPSGSHVEDTAADQPFGLAGVGGRAVTKPGSCRPQSHGHRPTVHSDSEGVPLGVLSVGG